MKLKLRADKNDLIVFGVVCLFLLYVVAACVANVTSIIQNGVPTGLNPLFAFYPEKIVTTMGIWLATIFTLIGSSSSYFFSWEKGFGYTSEKKEDGYSRWAKPKEIQTAKEVEKIPFVDKEAKFGGTPIIYDKDNAYIDNANLHTMVIGATGSGKTAGIINPTMKMLMKGRESIVITDPKGEIYEDNYKLLKDLGYQIIVLNFREPQKGTCWNPYDLPYQFQKEGNFDKANELLNDLSTNIVVDGQGQDPFWQNAAADYLTGLGLALFQDAEYDQININSINLMINQGEERYGASTYMKEYFKLQNPTSPVAINLAGTVTTADETKAGIMTVLQQKVKTLAVTKNLSEMLSKNEFDMSSIGEKPTALFLIIQDEKTTYHSLATIFIKQCYESLVSVAYKHGGALPVRVNFLLDEFANMPKIKDISTMVTAARSRHIRFTFIIQNFAQLDKTYGKEDAQTIRGNCVNTIYLLTGELSALEEISKLCGDKLVRVGKDKKEETRPLVTISELQRMKPDEYILVRHRCPPYKGKLKMDFKSDFGFGIGADLYGKDVVYPERTMDEVKVFDIKEFVKQKKQEKMGLPNQNPFATQGGMPGMPAFPNAPTAPSGMPNSDFDLDQMIKDIDKKIAELEKEEEEEKKKEEAKKKEESKKVSEDNIIKPRILDDETFDKMIKEAEKLENESKTNQLSDNETNSVKPVEILPNSSDIIDSSNINFENFSVKEEYNPKQEIEIPVEKPKEENNTKFDSDDESDDFFDDFFFEE